MMHCTKNVSIMITIPLGWECREGSIKLVAVLIVMGSMEKNLIRKPQEVVAIILMPDYMMEGLEGGIQQTLKTRHSLALIALFKTTL